MLMSDEERKACFLDILRLELARLDDKEWSRLNRQAGEILQVAYQVSGSQIPDHVAKATLEFLDTALGRNPIRTWLPVPRYEVDHVPY
jgi:hypothetical protein